MMIGSLHLFDILIVVLYLAAVVYIGKRAAKGTGSEDGFFLAGRKLGKLYQFFLNFGNATEPSGAVSTASFVYQQGAPGAWLSFQTVFMNPYFWFMNVWFRRARLTTVSDLFEDRYHSRKLSMFYAMFQILVACVFLGFANVTAYTIASSLVVKQESQWTASDRSSVEGYNDLRRLERAFTAGTMPAEAKPQLDALRERRARGELHSYITILNNVLFYVVFAIVVGAYIVMGGMAAAAVNEALQSVLIIVFSILLIPTGLHYIGGWHALGEKVPAKMFDLFGSGASTEQFSVASLCAILLVSIIQNGGLSHNMGICGSAKTEFAARTGVSGNYLKRLMIIMWAFAGLIAVAMFGPTGLSDPDGTWGAMSNRLLGPGLIGLMLAGVLAGTMSTLAAKALAISSLFVRNVYRQIWPDIDQQRGVFFARCTIVAVLALGALSAWLMGDFLSIVNIVLTVNIPFGACVLLGYFWRRLTVQGVWSCVILSTLVILVIPWTAAKFPALSTNQFLAQTSLTPSGRPAGVFFANVIHANGEDLTSPLVGSGRFNLECLIMDRVGLRAAPMTPNQRLTAQFFFDGLFPFAVLLIASLLTRPTDPEIVAQFYGKMKTPVGETPELEAAAMEETRRNPARFDGTKLFPRSSWEFCKWTKVDTVGFLICSALSAAIVFLFIAVLRWGAP